MKIYSQKKHPSFLMTIIILLSALSLIEYSTKAVNGHSNIVDKEDVKTLIPAFPGAEGFGATSIGGRGGRVIEVTNLNDSGSGSLRSALQAKGPRIVVFRVSGTIKLKDTIRLNEKNSFLTIAGQTAPGGGITIRGTDNNIIQIQKGAHDIIIRYLRLRNGSGEASGSGHDNLTISGAYNIIADHLSMSWSTDENVSLYRDTNNPPIYNITIQRSIIAEGLKGHSNGLIISGTADYSNADNPIEEYWKIYDISLHHNLFLHNTHRNPRITAGGVKIINNVVYNWKYRIGASTRGSVYDNINNYARPGPMSNIERLYLHENFIPDRPWDDYPNPSIYTSGNIVESIKDNPSTDDWGLYLLNFVYTELPVEYRRFTPLPTATFPVKIQSATDAFESVIADVGANMKVDCDGKWISNSDAVDLRLLADVKNRTGENKPIENPEAAGGYPLDVPGDNCIDSDHDGMPDAWETKHGFNPKDPSDSSIDSNGNGYTNVEEFINEVE